MLADSLPGCVNSADKAAAVHGDPLPNLIDRPPGGQVTDYLNTGWWTTFNRADVFFVGCLLIPVLSWRTDRPQPAQP
ncbi:signal peptidase II [Streptomyces rubiginosohelvolus]|uniref:signal peptidase II n=1 Tax=Streptomyces TaxID=1883 RepID=UPI0033198141